MYRIWGYIPTQRDDNADLDARAQTQIQESVIYETDDAQEVQAILNAGGYIDSNDVYHVAIRADSIGDPDADVASVSGSEDTLRKSEVLPENSSATIDSSGRVRTDRGKRPIEEEDVKAMAESEVDVPPMPRKIQP